MSGERKLIVVDDSQTSRQIMRAMIARLRGDWVVFESDNGYDALDLVRMVRPDYVTMDVNMPKMSGIEAAGRILADWPSTRIVLVTANIQDAVADRARELGIGFLEKPLNAQSVAAAVAFFERSDDGQ